MQFVFHFWLCYSFLVFFTHLWAQAHSSVSPHTFTHMHGQAILMRGAILCRAATAPARDRTSELTSEEFSVKLAAVRTQKYRFLWFLKVLVALAWDQRPEGLRESTLYCWCVMPCGSQTSVCVYMYCTYVCMYVCMYKHREVSWCTHINLSCLVLPQHQAEDILIGSGTQTQVERTLVIGKLTQVH